MIAHAGGACRWGLGSGRAVGVARRGVPVGVEPGEDRVPVPRRADRVEHVANDRDGRVRQNRVAEPRDPLVARAGIPAFGEGERPVVGAEPRERMLAHIRIIGRGAQRCSPRPPR